MEIRTKKLRCPIGTSNTLEIKFFKDVREFVTTDPRTIHMLKQSLVVRIQNLPESDQIYIEEVPQGQWESDENNPVILPDFGYNHWCCVWVAPQTVTAFGKEAVMRDLPRAIKRQWKYELLESRTPRNSY